MLPRLKTAEQFAAVLDASRSRQVAPSGVWKSEHFVLHLACIAALRHTQQANVCQDKPNDAKQRFPSIVLGVICPKRWAKRAVTRNTIKRQIYAMANDFVAHLPPACVVVRLSHGFSDEFKSATSAALKTMIRAELQCLLDTVSKRLMQQGRA